MERNISNLNCDPVFKSVINKIINNIFERRKNQLIVYIIMSLIENLKNILCKDSSIMVNRARLSYIERLFPEFKDYVIIYKKVRFIIL